MPEMRIIISAMIIISLLRSGAAGETGTEMEDNKWYVPVNIGMHIDPNTVKEERLSSAQAKEIFQKVTDLTPQARARFEALRDEWLKKNNEKYGKQFANDKLFRMDKKNDVSVHIHEFTKSEVRLYVLFIYGYSRWHHYYVLLKNYVVPRGDMIDETFRLDDLEKLYSFSFEGVGHGTGVEEMVTKLGTDYSEYAGQSPQYRNIYYEKYDIEIVIQDFEVKYLRKGRPGWAGANKKE